MFDELKSLAIARHAELRELAAGFSDETITRTIHIPFFPDPPCVITVAEDLVQLALHGQHHRGQLMTRLKDFGGEPANADWIIWLWRQKPQPRWD